MSGTVLATYPVPLRPSPEAPARPTGASGVFASELNVPSVDLAVEFAGTTDSATGISDMDTALVEADGLHPNDAGTQIMALAFADLFRTPVPAGFTASAPRASRWA